LLRWHFDAYSKELDKLNYVLNQVNLGLPDIGINDIPHAIAYLTHYINEARRKKNTQEN
jgi:putative alpha-1,2-mannosidase